MAYLKSNVVATLNVLEAMVKNEIGELVFASTSALYGEAAVRPTPKTIFQFRRPFTALQSLHAR